MPRDRSFAPSSLRRPTTQPRTLAHTMLGLAIVAAAVIAWAIVWSSGRHALAILLGEPALAHVPALDYVALGAALGGLAFVIRLGWTGGARRPKPRD